MLKPHEKECLLACNACAAVCLQCFSACLAEDDPKAMVRCIALDAECADLCRFTAASVARGDTHARAVCALCATVCQDCAAECAQHDMDHCRQCADACQRCADACAAMA